MLEVRVGEDAVRIGSRLSVSFQRTLRLPEDSRTYPLPPGLGRLPVRRVNDFRGRVPGEWLRRGTAAAVFIPLRRREAMWLAFEGAAWKPNAVKVGVGMVNAVSGGSWDRRLHDDPQDYLVCPEQPWLDGINAGDGFVRQFVAAPLGRGDTVEGQVTGAERHGGVQLLAYAPRPGRFPDRPPRPRAAGPQGLLEGMPESIPAAMGLAAGGMMRQKIYPDRYGLEVWDQANRGEVWVHLVDAAMFRQITGRDAPPSPITARDYTAAGLPWFDLYDDDRGDVAAPAPLRRVKSPARRERERKGKAGPSPDGRGARGDAADSPVAVPPAQVHVIRPAAPVAGWTGSGKRGRRGARRPAKGHG
jgi:hypothetical protein